MPENSKRYAWVCARSGPPLSSGPPNTGMQRTAAGAPVGDAARADRRIGSPGFSRHPRTAAADAQRWAAAAVFVER
jgi:hypothetical protein